jgi:TPP-dependent pyruvate/acetoin dehydrogenase alpha subunit
VLCFFGDGTSNRGTFHESLNMCAVLKLPVVFLCENNGWAVSVPTAVSTANPDIADRAKGYNIPGVTIDGNDVEQAYRTVSEAIARARRGEGPSLIEGKTYRLWGHWIGDPDNYRTREEVERHWQRDPIAVFERKLIADGLIDDASRDKIDLEARAEIDRGVADMQSQPFPKPESALEGVYA